MTTTTRSEIAEQAYLATFDGPWGLKASEEDALLSVLNAFYPAFPKHAEGIYAIRADKHLSALATALYEISLDGGDVHDIVAALLPKLDEATRAVLADQRDDLVAEVARRLDVIPTNSGIVLVAAAREALKERYWFFPGTTPEGERFNADLLDEGTYTSISEIAAFLVDALTEE